LKKLDPQGVGLDGDTIVQTNESPNHVYLSGQNTLPGADVDFSARPSISFLCWLCHTFSPIMNWLCSRRHLTLFQGLRSDAASMNGLL